MDKKQEQKLRRIFKAQGRIPVPKPTKDKNGNVIEPGSAKQIKIARKRLWQGAEFKQFGELADRGLTVGEAKLVKRQLLAHVRWHRRGPRFCRLCWRLFLPHHAKQIYHANSCSAFVEQAAKRGGVLNAVDFLPHKTLREIGGTILLPRAYIIVWLLGLCELRFRCRIVKYEAKRLWFKVRRQEEPYWFYLTNPRKKR